MHSTLVIIAISFFCLVYCHLVARRRGLKAPFWGAMGLLFGPLAIPFVHLLNPKNTP